MSQHSETGGLPLDSTTKPLHQPEPSTKLAQTPSRVKHHKTSHSSIDQPAGRDKTNPRPRPGTTKQPPSGPHTGSSRPEQRPLASPINMASHLPSVHYTRTGRISKAKKGLKVHNCDHCGRSYTRAEHLRRHQKNHAQDDALVCEFPECGKVFHRPDLLHRHQERHSDPGKESRQQSIFSPEPSPEAPPVAVPAPISSTMMASTLPPAQSYHATHPVSSIAESVVLPRYTHNPFRTPQIPRTPQAPSSSFRHVPRSSPHSAPSPNQSKHPNAYLQRQNGQISVSVDSMTSSLWNDPCTQSPGYSSSSGYASPIPGPGEYSHLYANAPYHRPRTPSNASLFESWSSYPSRSPTSATSTLAYPWASSDKMPTTQGLAYLGTSYPMTSMSMLAGTDPMTGYGHFGPKTMVQRDEEEAVILFGDQQYGMGPIAHTYSFEQDLDYYWRLFHPTFPVVHRFTFGSMSQSPMLHAAMIAIEGQYSNDTSVKRKSRILHDRCIKVLERREQETMTEPDRLCDFQAMFLIEVLSQYRARRAAKVLSSRFDKVYHKAVEDFRSTTLQIHDLVVPLVQLENGTMERWVHWIELATWQRLLLSCYVVESQQPLLLGREPLPSLIQDTGFDLPLPGHHSLWDATDPSEWALAAQRHSTYQSYVYEVSSGATTPPFDTFQSSVLIAAHYNRQEASPPYMASPSVLDVEHLLDTSSVTTKTLLAAKLAQVTPLRALLSVSGESWILSEKVASPQAFTALKTTLRTWLARLWSTPESQGVPVKEALKLSVAILQHALQDQRDAVTLDIGTDMGIYFAALVLWAIITAANTRGHGLQQTTQLPRRRLSQSPPVFDSNSWTSVPSIHSHMLSHVPQTSSAPSIVPMHGQPRSPLADTPLDDTPLLSHAQIIINTISFLSTVVYDFENAASTRQSPTHLSRHQSGCTSLLLWVKLRLRGVPLEDHSGAADALTCKPGDGLGELLDGVIGSLERMLKQGWAGWSI